MTFSPTRRGMLASVAASGAALTTSLYGVASAQGVHFPGPSNFAGSYDRKASDAQDGGQSTYNGSIAVTLLDRCLVQSALPSNFSLAQRTDGGSAHPVIHLVGHQRKLMVLQGGVPVAPGDPDYQEVILLIPFVNRGSGSKWHTFVVGMYLDNGTAVTLGDVGYNYNKVLGRLAESGAPDDLTMRVTVLGLMFKGEVRLTGPWRTSDNARMTRWNDLQEIFKMPLVGSDPAGIAQDSCSYWEWDYTNAEVASATSRHQFLQSLPGRNIDGWGPSPLSSDPDGTFAIRGLRWRLALLTELPACSF